MPVLGNLYDATVETIARPLAYSLKKGGASYPKFRQTIVKMGQRYHAAAVGEEKAIETAANDLSHCVKPVYLLLFPLLCQLFLVKISKAFRVDELEPMRTQIEKEGMNLHRKDDIERALKPFKEYQEENDKKWEALHKRMKFDSIIQNKEKDILLWMNEAFEQNRAKTKEDLKEVIRNKVLRDVLKERDAKNDGGSSGVRDVTATAEEHNMIVDNPSTDSKDEEKVKPVNLGERKNYPFEGFNISDEAPKNLIKYCQQQSKVSQNEECLINIIKGFSIPAGLPWHLADKVYIPINCGDEFHWVFAIVILKERRIQIYDSMSRRRHSTSSSEIQKLAKILHTYLAMSGFLDQKVRADWLTIEAYQDKVANPFDVQYVDEIVQQTIGSLDCGPFVAAYTEYLSDGLQVPNDGLDAGLLRKRYAALLWKYGEAKAQT
ncbi:hypothetical protein T459_20652 [Capsicum annuum]|uniref:Ubiquitin-like protease family profile domain-containing protein n=1 Tax=Capsicum annuum TaxID=4072 RepID=A0A2G2Z536_CAPAN|nr:hypothetical protein T459_20652 [Capsicum annuum]